MSEVYVEDGTLSIAYVLAHRFWLLRNEIVVRDSLFCGDSFHGVKLE